MQTTVNQVLHEEAIYVLTPCLASTEHLGFSTPIIYLKSTYVSLYVPEMSCSLKLFNIQPAAQFLSPVECGLSMYDEKNRDTI